MTLRTQALGAWI